LLEAPVPAAEVVFASAEALPAAIGRDDRPLVVMPYIDAAAAKRSAVQLARRAGTPVSVACIADDRRRGFIAVANAAFRRTAAPFVAYVAQDAFAGRGWLAHGVRALEAEQGGLLAFHDGKWAGALAAFGMVRADWARGNYAGDLFHPGYRRHYADTELTVLAMAAGALRHDPLAMLVEVDWDKEASAVSADDRALYVERAAAGFDGRVVNPNFRCLYG
jgi:hypothetical protein